MEKNVCSFRKTRFIGNIHKSLYRDSPIEIFFSSVFIMLFSLKSYAKKCFTVWRIYFSIKSYSTFSAKMFQAPFILYMVYCIPYMEVTVDFLPYMEVPVGKEKRQNMAK